MGAAIPIITAVAGVIGAGATAYGVTQRPRRPERVPMVPPPDIDQVTDDASREVEKKRRRAGRAATILTSPRGLSDDYTAAKPTLLGQ